MDPNTLLDEASPRVADLTPELRSLLDEMVSATRPRSRPARRMLTSAGLGIGLALGVAGTAAASVVLHYTFATVPDSTASATFSWTLASGRECTLDMQVGPRADEDPNYSSSQEQALAAARDWMASFDIGSVDVARTDDELEKRAVVSVATSRLADYLSARGYDIRSLNTGAGLECDQ